LGRRGSEEGRRGSPPRRTFRPSSQRKRAEDSPFDLAAGSRGRSFASGPAGLLAGRAPKPPAPVRIFACPGRRSRARRPMKAKGPSGKQWGLEVGPRSPLSPDRIPPHPPGRGLAPPTVSKHRSPDSTASRRRSSPRHSATRSRTTAFNRSSCRRLSLPSISSPKAPPAGPRIF